MIFSEKIKLEDDYYLWLNAMQDKYHVVLKDETNTFLTFLETHGYEVKKVAKNSIDAPETATKPEIDALILRGLSNALDDGETLTEEDKGVFKAMCEIKKVLCIFWEMKRRDAANAED